MTPPRPAPPRGPAFGPPGLFDEDAPRPDAAYAVVTGVYVASLLTPPVVVALSRWVRNAALLYVGFLGTVAVITAVAGWVTTRIGGLAVSLGRRDATWLLVALPFGWFAAAFAADAFGADPPGLSVPLALFGAAAGMLAGIVLVSMSRTRHAASALAGVDDRVVWEARWPRRQRRLAAAASVASAAVTVAGLVAEFAFDVAGARYAYWVLMVVFPVTANAWNRQRYRATDAGLALERPLQRTFRPWSSFAGYELTDAALVVRPRPWWRPAVRCDRADLADVEGIVAELDAVLERER